MTNEIYIFAEANIWACSLQSLEETNEPQIRSRKTELQK